MIEWEKFKDSIILEAYLVTRENVIFNLQIKVACLPSCRITHSYSANCIIEFESQCEIISEFLILKILNYTWCKITKVSSVSESYKNRYAVRTWELVEL